MAFIQAIYFAFCILFESWNVDNGNFTKHLNTSNELDSYINITELEEYPNVCDQYDSENCAENWLKEMNKIGKRNGNRIGNLNFHYSTNITQKKALLKLKFQRQHMKIYRRMENKLWQFKWRQFQSRQIRRIFKLMSPTIESKRPRISEMLLNISSQIETIYNHAKPCFTKCLREGESDIVDVFRNERDYDKLIGFWTAWRNATGQKIKKLFVERMDLENIGAKENGYNDAASFSLNMEFEENNFNATSLQLYDDILPFYRELHGYVRFCLLKFYPGRFNGTGAIPAHILGNVWGQQWQNILPILRKCQSRVSNFSIRNEVDNKLRSMSVGEMFKIAEEFFTSIGLYKMTPQFWERSVLEQRTGTLINCHGSAHDFGNSFDYRIKMCTKKNIDDFTTIHHEMGHIQYYMAYQHLPYGLLGSANPAFHEAVGDTIALSVRTPEHLKKIGLISTIPSTNEFDMDHLLGTALEKVAFLPFAFMMDSYVWSIYNGSVSKSKLNQHWWDLRYRFQGVKPPVQRTETDFDAAAKYHISFQYSYLRYFISYLLQFQFYEAMCNLSGYQGPLHRCDFYQSKTAGRRFLKMLKQGRSMHWKDSLEILTGSRDVSAKALLKYFSPLYKWLKETNKVLKVPIGW